MLKVFDRICEHPDVLAQCLAAIAGLVYLNQNNQKAFSGKDTISKIIEVGQKNIDNHELI